MTVWAGANLGLCGRTKRELKGKEKNLFGYEERGDQSELEGGRGVTLGL